MYGQVRLVKFVHSLRVSVFSEISSTHIAANVPRHLFIFGRYPYNAKSTVFITIELNMSYMKPYIQQTVSIGQI